MCWAKSIFLYKLRPSQSFSGPWMHQYNVFLNFPELYGSSACYEDCATCVNPSSDGCTSCGNKWFLYGKTCKGNNSFDSTHLWSYLECYPACDSCYGPEPLECRVCSEFGYYVAESFDCQGKKAPTETNSYFTLDCPAAPDDCNCGIGAYYNSGHNQCEGNFDLLCTSMNSAALNRLWSKLQDVQWANS